MLGFDNLEHANYTDIGMRRQHNEDNKSMLLAGDLEKWHVQGHLFLVADGMGAHATGEKASELAAQIIPHTYHKHAQQGPVAALRKAFIEANASIHSRGQQNREFEGMGTTGTALLIREEGVWLGHVGDSRAYRVRDGVIEQLTFDHSLVWVYAKQQRIDPDKVENIPHNVIVRSLGPEPLVQVDVEGPHPLKPGDVYVLCSDGLSGQLTDAEIGAIATSLPPMEACRVLIDLANLRGGPDNITTIVIRLGGNPGESLAPAAKPKASLLARVPWYYWSFLISVVLIGGAVAGVLVLNNSFVAGSLFVLAAVAFIAGMVGLLAVQYKRDKEAKDNPTDRPPAKSYRQAQIKVDKALVDKVARATQALRQRGSDRQWPVDGNGYQKHEQQATRHITEGNWVGAFQEYCRALRAVTEPMFRTRTKDDSITNYWTKNGH